jgi:peptide/nickel transport system permease protein
MSLATTAPPRREGRSARRPLLRYVVGRLVAAVLVLLAVSLLVFLFVHMAPGGPEDAIAGRTATEEQRARVRAEHGLDRSLVQQYASYVGSLVQLDFGQSYLRRTPTVASIADAAAISVPLLLCSWALAMAGGIVLGVLTALRPGSWFDRLVLGATTVGASAPAFAVGTLLAYVFGIQLGWFPVLGAGEPGLDRVRHLVLPVVTAAIIALASCTRFTRVRVGEILAEDQMTFALARGLGWGWIMRRVVLRNAGVQIVTLSGGIMISLVAGLIIVEQVFNLRGIGTLMIESIRQQDIPMVQAITLFVALFVVAVNLVADLFCFAIDPRLRAGLGGDR